MSIQPLVVAPRDVYSATVFNTDSNSVTVKVTFISVNHNRDVVEQTLNAGASAFFEKNDGSGWAWVIEEVSASNSAGRSASIAQPFPGVSSPTKRYEFTISSLSGRLQISGSPPPPAVHGSSGGGARAVVNTTEVNSLIADIYHRGGPESLVAVGKLLDQPVLQEAGSRLARVEGGGDRGIFGDILKTTGPVVLNLATQLLGNRDIGNQRGILGSILETAGPAALSLVSKLIGDRDLEAVALQIPHDERQRGWADLLKAGGSAALQLAKKFMASRDPDEQRGILGDIVNTVGGVGLQFLGKVVGNRDLQLVGEEAAASTASETNRKLFANFAKIGGIPGLRMGVRLTQEGARALDDQRGLFGDVLKTLGPAALQIVGNVIGDRNLEASGSALANLKVDESQRGILQDILKVGGPIALKLATNLLGNRGLEDSNRGFSDILKVTGPVVLNLVGKLVGNRGISDVAGTLEVLSPSKAKQEDWAQLLRIGGVEAVRKTTQLTAPLPATIKRGIWGDVLKVAGSAGLELAGKLIGDRDIIAAANAFPSELTPKQRGIFGDILSIAGPAALQLGVKLAGDRSVSDSFVQEALEDLETSSKRGADARAIIQRDIIAQRDFWGDFGKAFVNTITPVVTGVVGGVAGGVPGIIAGGVGGLVTGVTSTIKNNGRDLDDKMMDDTWAVSKKPRLVDVGYY